MRSRLHGTSDTERRLQEALVARIQSAPAPRPPARFVLLEPRMPQDRRPIGVRLAAVLVASLAVATAVVALTPDRERSHPVDVAAGPDSQLGDHAVAPPRVIVDLPGVSSVFVDETLTPPTEEAESGPGVDGFYVQSFRTPAGLAPPLLWVLTVPPPPSEMNDYGFESGRPITVQGGTAHVVGASPLFRLTWPGPEGGGVIMSSWGLSEGELTAVADGLRSRPAGWDATFLPHGLAPALDRARASSRRPENVRRVDTVYRTESGRQIQLHVTDTEPVSFENRIMGIGNARSVEEVAVGGRQGLIIDAGSDASSWSVLWQPTDTTMAELSLSKATADDVVSADDVIAVVSGVRVVDESEWQDRLPSSTIRSEALASEVARLRADTPRPPGQPPATELTPLARDRRVLADDVMRDAMCAWARDWLTATASHDGPRAEAAAAALKGASDWPVVAEAYPSGSPAAGPAAMVLSGGIAGYEDYVDSSCR